MVSLGVIQDHPHHLHVKTHGMGQVLMWQQMFGLPVLMPLSNDITHAIPRVGQDLAKIE